MTTLFPKHTTKTTPELKVGDVVWAHGARLRLVKLNIDAEKAQSLADGHWRLMLHHARTEEDRARVELEYQRNLTIRSFGVEFVGYLPNVTGSVSPEWWTKNYTVQGNHLAVWSVECE